MNDGDRVIARAHRILREEAARIEPEFKAQRREYRSAFEELRADWRTFRAWLAANPGQAQAYIMYAALAIGLAEGLVNLLASLREASLPERPSSR